MVIALASFLTGTSLAYFAIYHGVEYCQLRLSPDSSCSKPTIATLPLPRLSVASDAHSGDGEGKNENIT